MPLFYHFTSTHHLKAILDAGRLNPTESNVGSPIPGWEPRGAHVGPDVVWLLDTPELGGHPHGLVVPDDSRLRSLYDKTEVRFTVDVPAIRWLDWEPAQCMHPEWKTVMIESAGGMDAVHHWYVFPAPIRANRWKEIRA